LVVADTSPIFYLLSIGQVEILPRIFTKVFIPDAVHQELRHPTAPSALKEWIEQRPSWLEVMPVEWIDDAAQRRLIDLPGALAKLKQTNFRYRQEMIDDLLNEFPGQT
jgi:predicted nucleic acid-binding protein